MSDSDAVRVVALEREFELVTEGVERSHYVARFFGGAERRGRSAWSKVGLCGPVWLSEGLPRPGLG